MALVTESHAQLLKARNAFNRADSLRGQLTPLRTCYDINYYHLDVRIDPNQRHIEGTNLFRFTATTDFDRLQFDLFDNLHIDSVLYRGQQLPFKREFNAVFIDFPETIGEGRVDSFTVFYAGNPIQAKRAPWAGGLHYKKDSNGKHW